MGKTIHEINICGYIFLEDHKIIQALQMLHEYHRNVETLFCDIERRRICEKGKACSAFGGDRFEERKEKFSECKRIEISKVLQVKIGNRKIIIEKKNFKSFGRKVQK